LLSASGITQAAIYLNQAASNLDSNWLVKSAFVSPVIDGVTTSGAFVVVEYKVVNNTKNDLTVATSPKLKDAKDRVYTAIENTAERFSKTKFDSIVGKKLPPGVEQIFSEVYELPKDIIPSNISTQVGATEITGMGKALLPGVRFITLSLISGIDIDPIILDTDSIIDDKFTTELKAELDRLRILSPKPNKNYIETLEQYQKTGNYAYQRLLFNSSDLSLGGDTLAISLNPDGTLADDIPILILHLSFDKSFLEYAKKNEINTEHFKKLGKFYIPEIKNAAQSYDKFKEWEQLALKNQVAPFNKVFSNSQATFVWDGKSAFYQSMRRSDFACDSPTMGKMSKMAIMIDEMFANAQTAIELKKNNDEKAQAAKKAQLEMFK
jgi:hypothetical protein